MGFVKDFKEFAVKGNVIDLAVGVVIGGAFGKIVSALVDDIIMPAIGVVTGGKGFDDKFFVLKAAKEGETYTTIADAKKAGANILSYGHFVQTVIDFLIIAFCIFIIIRLMARMKREEAAAPPPAPPAPTKTELLLTEIRDALKK